MYLNQSNTTNTQPVYIMYLRSISCGNLIAFVIIV